MKIPAGKNIYFISDLHLGVPGKDDSRTREVEVVRWLRKISEDAMELHMVGDIFDFWFEYKHAVPRGYTRLLGELARISDSGINIYWYYGNHDMWIKDYIPNELGVKIIPDDKEWEYNGQKFYISHGDGLGPGDHRYKFLKKIFRSKLCQWLFARFHPNFGIGLANFFSRKSRYAEPASEREFQGEDKEWLVLYAKDKLKEKHRDYFIFGHRHLPLDIDLGQESRYINLGDWLHHYTYGVFDGKNLKLVKWEVRKQA